MTSISTISTSDVSTTTPSDETPEQTRARKPQAIAIGQLILSDDFRFRYENDEATIGDYEEIYRQHREDREISKSARCPLGTLTVLCQEDDKYVVVAGRLRFLAAQRAGLETLQCVVITDRDEALRIGLESNRHGLPLTVQDRALCISIAVTRLSGLSNRKIATMIGCPASTVNAVVNKYKLRSDKPTVVGLDGKKYRQRKSRKDSAAETTTATGTDPSTIANGSTIDETCSRPFDKMRAALGITNADDSQRVHTYLGIVKDIVAEGFSNEVFQQEFLANLKLSLFE
jgi:hypothetical protein